MFALDGTLHVTPFRVRAFASSGESATSSALLLRAFTDSSEVPILTEDNLR